MLVIKALLSTKLNTTSACSCYYFYNRNADAVVYCIFACNGCVQHYRLLQILWLLYTAYNKQHPSKTNTVFYFSRYNYASKRVYFCTCLLFITCWYIQLLYSKGIIIRISLYYKTLLLSPAKACNIKCVNKSEQHNVKMCL